MTQVFGTSDVSVRPLSVESSKPAVCWAGIWSGVFVTLSVTAVLTVLGTGLGFAMKSPWAQTPSAKTLGVMSIIWLILIQWIASSVGGYITGRLRTRWVNVHTHEVFFRDTAHGFVTWAVSTVIVFALFAMLGISIGHHASHMAAPAVYNMTENGSGASPDATGATGEKMQGGAHGVANPLAYYSDILFRLPAATTTQPTQDQDVRGEANRILLKGIKDDSLTEEDKNYLAQLVSIHAGLTEPDARRRVDDVVARIDADEGQLRELADNARKTASIIALCTALAMLVGAFVASVSAALGGNIRDRHP